MFMPIGTLAQGKASMRTIFFMYFKTALMFQITFLLRRYQ